MKLTDLDPHFIRRCDRFEYEATDNIDKADGIVMQCPACHWSFGRGRTPDAHVHRVTLWQPETGEWRFTGHDYRDLSAMAGRVVVAVTTGCQSRFHIRTGRVDFC